MSNGVENAPKRELIRPRPVRKKRPVAGQGQPSTAYATNPPKPPEDYRVPGTKPDPMAAHGHLTVVHTMEQQLTTYYKDYGEKVPQPKDFDAIVDLAVSGGDKVRKQRTEQASQDSIASTELSAQGELSKVTQIARAEKKGDLEAKAQILENLGSTAEREKLEADYKNRFPNKDVYADPRAKEFTAIAEYKKRFGDARPLEEIQKEVADEGPNANEHRIHNVDLHGAKAERSADLEYQLQKEQYQRQHSDSLDESEAFRAMLASSMNTKGAASLFRSHTNA